MTEYERVTVPDLKPGDKVKITMEFEVVRISADLGDLTTTVGGYHQQFYSEELEAAVIERIIPGTEPLPKTQGAIYENIKSNHHRYMLGQPAPKGENLDRNQRYLVVVGDSNLSDYGTVIRVSEGWVDTTLLDPNVYRIVKD